MSKVKNISSTNSVQPTTSPSLSPSSAENADIFSDLFNQLEIQSQAEKDAKDNKNSSDEQKNTQTTQKSEKSESAKKADKAKKARDDEDELSAEEKKEIEEIERHDISLDQLAEQLNVVLAKVQDEKKNQQNNQLRDVKVVFKGDDNRILEEAVANIDPALLRKVDVNALDEQLKKIMGNQGLLDVEVPGDVDAETLNQEELLEQALIDQELLDEQSMNELAPEQSFDENLASLAEQSEFKLSDMANQKSFAADQISNEMEMQNLKLDAGSDASPDLQMTFDDLMINTQPVENKGSTQGLQQALQNVRNAKAQNVLRLNQAQQNLVRDKVQNVMLNMAKNGKSGITRIQMHPEELGRIDVKIELKEKTIKADIVTDNLAAKDVIVKHLPMIREVVASENLMLDDFNARHDDQHFLNQYQQGEEQASQNENGESSQKSMAGADSHAENKEQSNELKEIIKERLKNDSAVNYTV